MESRFHILNRYRERYFSTALLSLKKASGQPCDFATIAHLRELAKKDGHIIISALEDSFRCMDVYHKHNADHMVAYMSRLTISLDMREIERHIYACFLKIAEVLKYYETLNLNAPMVAISSMDDFVAKKLASIKKDMPSHMKRYNSEEVIST